MVKWELFSKSESELSKCLISIISNQHLDEETLVIPINVGVRVGVTELGFNLSILWKYPHHLSGRNACNNNFSKEALEVQESKIHQIDR